MQLTKPTWFQATQSAMQGAANKRPSLGFPGWPPPPPVLTLVGASMIHGSMTLVGPF